MPARSALQTVLSTLDHDQSRNSAVLTKPIFFMRLRCAAASTSATAPYLARRSGRRWISGCGSFVSLGSGSNSRAWACPAPPCRSRPPCRRSRCRGRRPRAADPAAAGCSPRHVELHRVRLDRDRDDQHDEQHQHHVDQRRGVDVHHRSSPPRSPTLIAMSIAPRDAQRDAAMPWSGSVMKPTFRMPPRCTRR